MKKYKKIVLIIIMVIVIIGVIITISYNLCFKNYIPDNYIAVFHGGSGEQTYSTYIYKINNNQANSGFKYINTTNNTTYWGSSKRDIKVTSKGTVQWTDDVFTIAKKNNAYSYVNLPNDKKSYTIEEFQSMFLMN